MWTTFGETHYRCDKNWILLPPFTYIHRCRFRNVLKICRAFSTRWFPIHYNSIFNRMCGCSCIKEKCVFSPSQPLWWGKCFHTSQLTIVIAPILLGWKYVLTLPKKYQFLQVCRWTAWASLKCDRKAAFWVFFLLSVASYIRKYSILNSISLKNPLMMIQCRGEDLTRFLYAKKVVFSFANYLWHAKLSRDSWHCAIGCETSQSKIQFQ